MANDFRRERLDVALAIYLQDRDRAKQKLEDVGSPEMREAIEEADTFLKMFNRDRVAGGSSHDLT